MTDFLSNYRTGIDELDRELGRLVASVDEADQRFVFELAASAFRLSHEDNNRGELKLVTNAVKELRYSFEVFRPYIGTRKCSIFGSARIAPGEPAYECAREVAEKIAARDWMIITGAGPGIMKAGNEGAGADRSFGVNIMLPFEASANEFVPEDKLINFKYFFTRKVMFMKESDAYVLLPGGFGTMDETFELLTLMQTGKTPVAPIVLLDPTGSNYWNHWLRFVEAELGDAGLISPEDLALVHVASSTDDAVDEICRFYTGYPSMRFVGDSLIVRLNRPVGDEELAALNAEFAPLVESGSIQRTEATAKERRDDDHLNLDRLSLRFDRHKWAMLRLLIDRLNGHPDTAALGSPS